MKPKIINCIQGSPEWLSLRKNKITATDSAKIMDLNPWCTAYQCWEEKLGFKESQVLNDKMKEGSLLEEKAREAFNKKINSDFKPVVLESNQNSWQIASLDGMDSSGRILEIKCGEYSHKMAKNKEIPDYYFAQLQKQMWVANTDYALYMSYRSDDDYVYWSVNRNDEFIEKMNEQEKIFYDCLMNLTPPELTEKDYVIREDLQWKNSCEAYKKLNEEIKNLEKEREFYKNSLISLANGKSTKGLGVTVSKVIRKGNIDYNSIDALKSIDLEKFRKEPTIYMSIRNG